MTDQAYLELARQLDALPQRFPAPESAAAIRLLQKLFSPEQACWEA